MIGMTWTKWIGLAVMVLLAGRGLAAETGAEASDSSATEKKKPLYLIAEYDPQRDPAKDLQAAIKTAKKEKKHILLQVGGNWCSWCSTMTKYFHDTESVRNVLEKNYVLVKINYSTENKNEAFLANYPKVAAFPHLFILDSNGKVLHSQFTGDLEEGGSYSEKVMLEFLKKWTPASVAARQTETQDADPVPAADASE